MKSDVSKQNDVETIPTGDVNITNRVLNDYYKLEDAVSFSNVYLFLSYSFYSLKVLWTRKFSYQNRNSYKEQHYSLREMYR